MVDQQKNKNGGIREERQKYRGDGRHRPRGEGRQRPGGDGNRGDRRQGAIKVPETGSLR